MAGKISELYGMHQVSNQKFTRNRKGNRQDGTLKIFLQKKHHDSKVKNLPMVIYL